MNPMKLVFIDETENSTHVPGFYAVCAVAIDATKYMTVRQEIDGALDACGWNRTHEFKGACMFSASKGDSTVPVPARVDAVERIVSSTLSRTNARAASAVAWNECGPRVENHLALLEQAVTGALKPKPPAGKGKDLCVVFADQKDSVPLDRLSAAVHNAAGSRGFRLVEDVVVVRSSCSWPGVLLADVLAYLAMWTYASHKLGTAQATLFDDQDVPLTDAQIKKISAVQEVLEVGSDLRFCPKLPKPHSSGVKQIHETSGL